MQSALSFLSFCLFPSCFYTKSQAQLKGKKKLVFFSGIWSVSYGRLASLAGAYAYEYTVTITFASSEIPQPRDILIATYYH